MNELRDSGPFRVFLEGAGTIKSRFNKKYSWVEESFVFDKRTGKQVASNYSDEFVASSLRKPRLTFFLCVFGAVVSIIILRLLYIQLWKGNHYAALANQNRVRNIPIIAERGLIYDRYNQQLTQNVPNFSLALTPQDLPRKKEERARIVSEIAAITNEPEDVLAGLIEQYGSYSYESIVIKEDLDYETALQLQMESSGLPGISIQRGSKRLYTQVSDGTTGSSTPYSLAHVLGYLGKLSPDELDERYERGYLPSDSIGKTGVEKVYEEVLRGSYGRRRAEVDARGKEQATLAEEAPEPGKHVVLSIDAEMQQALERVMLDGMAAAGKERGAAVVTNPQTGEILALVNLPAFDNNDFSGGISSEQYAVYAENDNNPLFNRAIGGAYPSGSTIKPVIAAAALQEGVITAGTTFLSTGGIGVGQWFFPDWQAGGHGRTDVRWSIANSVNTFYYIIGGGYEDREGLGVARIKQYLERFGFGSSLGIDLPGEAEGFIPSKAWKEEAKNERWYVGDTYNLSIGQGDLLTSPLQIAMMTSAVANNGTLYKPRVVQKFIDPVTREEQLLPAESIRKNMVSPSHLNTVRLGMRDCVTKGSCRRLSLLPFSAAGKTGTAQWSSTKEPHAWFTSFAPFERPEITVTILIEEGEGGSATAAPIAYQFYRWWDAERY